MFNFYKAHKKATVFSSVLLFLALLVPLSVAAAKRPTVHQIVVPSEDRFVPFVTVIRAGEKVMWVNQDTDDHTVVSNDFFTTSDNKGVNILLPGTDSNGGKPGVLTLRFKKPGVFAYYCRFHSMLDAQHQPVAPGPDGGIQDAKGNFGTPMNGVIIVLSGNGGD